MCWWSREYNTHLMHLVIYIFFWTLKCLRKTSRENGQHCQVICIYQPLFFFFFWLRGPMMQQSYTCLQSCIRVLCPDVFVIYCSPTVCVWAFLWDLIGQLVPEDSANSKPHKFSLGTSYISVQMAFHLIHSDPNTYWTQHTGWWCHL